MKEVLLKADAREVKSKHTLKEIRAKGLIPATLYGKGEETQAVTVDSKTLLGIVKAEGANAVITLETAKGKKPAILKELQRDMISQAPIHADFQAIDLKNKIEVMVPLHIEGVAVGVKDFGGLMETLHREIKVSCLPTNVPKTISLDVTNLNIGDTVTVATLPKLDGVDYVQEADTLIVHIVAPKAEEEKAADATAEPAQPEVIAKGKKEEEGAAGDKK
jgi:large subunit ribosomal protein L25